MTGLIFWTLLLRCPAAPPAIASCTCEKNRLEGGWCIRCRRGFVAGVEIPSFQLFEALDAHGHEYDANLLQCAQCRRFSTSGGFCEKCRLGFKDRLLYFSDLSYALAKGRLDPHPTCRQCRENATRFGWCNSCKLGRIGNVAIANDEDYARAETGMKRLLAALQELPRCEWCAVALWSNGYCATCRVSYQDGQKVP